ncbi:hypothetical protein BHE74_00056488 [Ensete ventricosum]|nr:hypothetical protein BHE74_00056488 [Ensete ventricosum]
MDNRVNLLHKEVQRLKEGGDSDAVAVVEARASETQSLVDNLQTELDEVSRHWELVEVELVRLRSNWPTCGGSLSTRKGSWLELVDGRSYDIGPVSSTKNITRFWCRSRGGSTAWSLPSAQARPRQLMAGAPGLVRFSVSGADTSSGLSRESLESVSAEEDLHKGLVGMRVPSDA